MSNPNAAPSAMGVSYTATWQGEDRVYRRLCPLVPHHYSDISHLLAWPTSLLKLEYKNVIVRYEAGAFIVDEWNQLNYSEVLLSKTELGQILIHAQRARFLVALHEEGR